MGATPDLPKVANERLGNPRPERLADTHGDSPMGRDPEEPLSSIGQFPPDGNRSMVVYALGVKFDSRLEWATVDLSCGHSEKMELRTSKHVYLAQAVRVAIRNANQGIGRRFEWECRKCP